MAANLGPGSKMSMSALGRPRRPKESLRTPFDYARERLKAVSGAAAARTLSSAGLHACCCLITAFFNRVARSSIESGFLIYDFLADRKSSSWGVWAAPGGRDTFQKAGGLRPPLFWKVSRPPGAAQTPKIDDFRSVKKSDIKNPGVIRYLTAAHCSTGPTRASPARVR